LPFQKVYEETPIEIVFDLDPPSREFFHLAIEAALLIKKMLDELELISFIKTSGGKGLQIHIPIPEKSMTYDETALFTKAIAWTVERKSPEKFTTERFKNKRNGRLYIDYVQHGKDKTIIAPYSTRNRADATVATPLFWEEVTSELRPETFTLECVLNRVQAIGCPFKDYFHVGERQKMNKLMKLISSLSDFRKECTVIAARVRWVPAQAHVDTLISAQDYFSITKRSPNEKGDRLGNEFNFNEAQH